MWGPYQLWGCDALGDMQHWEQAAASNCYDCATNSLVCGRNSPELLVHAFISSFPKISWQQYLLPVQSFLMTQNLKKARMVVWTEDGLDPDHPASAFFKTFSKYVHVKRLPPWPKFVDGTPLKGHPFWGNGQTVKTLIHTPTGYANVVRLLLLARYGGLWVDMDTLFLRVSLAGLGWGGGLAWANVCSTCRRRAASAKIYMHTFE